jgi:catechol 2,3-dioxygenase-like lactoylglutathione lyase family enzyme
MTLTTSNVGAVVAVSDMRRARDFYERKLGLAAGSEDPDGGRTYTCGGGTSLHIFSSPANAGKSSATVAGWTVEDLERSVDELTANGVTFERYDTPPFATNSKGIAEVGGSKSAWFKDPDGNTLGLIQP